LLLSPHPVQHAQNRCEPIGSVAIVRQNRQGYEKSELIDRLRKTSRELGRLVSRYDEVNRDIHRIESEAPAEDAVVEVLKKQRLRLKDEIASFLAAFESRM
jgi:uncharacterized protein